MIWAALSMTAALVMTACSNDDNTAETPAAQQAIVKTIPYSVTVNGGAGTRATVDNDMKTLKFATGDKLYITGTNISGVLALKSGDEGKSSGATFEGDLTYTGAGSPASDLSLTATLVSAQQTDGTEVTINSTTKAVTVNYPTTAYCADVATAVQKYSNLTGTSTYSAKSFTLSQNTAFLNFVITFEDGTTTGTELSAVVSNNSAAICTANVTTATESEKVVAKFVLPVASTTTLSSATVTMGSKAALNITNATLTGKIYNITRSAAATSLSELKTAINGGTDCSSYIGWEVNSAGAIAKSGVSGTKIGYVAYVSTSDVDAGVSGSRILVIASADAAATTLTWGSSGTARDLTADDLNGYSNTNTLQGYGSEAHPAAYAAWNYSATIPSGGATPAHWFMPTKKQWENMRDAKGGTYGAMATAYGISGHYWTSTEVSNNNAWRFVTNSKIQSNMKSLDYNVRSIFAY